MLKPQSVADKILLSWKWITGFYQPVSELASFAFSYQIDCLNWVTYFGPKKLSSCSQSQTNILCAFTTAKEPEEVAIQFQLQFKQYANDITTAISRTDFPPPS